MNGAVGILVGLIAGAVLLGLGLYLYFILATIKALTEQLKSLISTLAPIFSSEDVLKGFKSFTLLAMQGEQIGRRLETLDDTIQNFYKVVFRTPNPVATMTSSDSYTTGYSEEEAAAREVTQKLRKEGVELDEGKVFRNDSEQPPAVF